jgi:ADP-dependent NAD(P)H-hydrate dehydratase
MKKQARARRANDGATPVTRALLQRWPLPQPNGRLGKEERGRVFVFGGSEQTPGAVVLASLGALRAGAGKLLVATSRGVASSVATAMPEARVIGLRQAKSGELARGSSRAVFAEARRYDALLIGPGMIDAVAGIELLRESLTWPTRPTLLVDAAPLVELETLCKVSRKKLMSNGGAGVIATPHAGEMARLCGIDREEILADPRTIARDIAGRLGVVVALKGSTTYIAGPDGTVFVNTAGNPGLGTSGSGDVLAGIIAGLSARGADPLQATVWGVHLHACAGDLLARRVGPLGFLAREILSEIPALLAICAGG